MIKTNILAVALVLAASGVAQAGGQDGSIGVGADYTLNGFGGASVNYDAGDFHVGGFLGFADPAGGDNTLFGVGARFFYHVHSTAMSDFGIGGNVGIISVPDDMDPDNDRALEIYIEPAMQIRLFLAPNVALSASTGIIIGVVDASGVAITGQGVGGLGGASTLTGGNLGIATTAGLHYYFFGL